MHVAKSIDWRKFWVSLASFKVIFSLAIHTDHFDSARKNEHILPSALNSIVIHLRLMRKQAKYLCDHLCKKIRQMDWLIGETAITGKRTSLCHTSLHWNQYPHGYTCKRRYILSSLWVRIKPLIKKLQICNRKRCTRLWSLSCTSPIMSLMKILESHSTLCLAL